MFDIEYRGGNCVVITTKKVSIVIDAKRSVFGLKDIVLSDAIELATEERFLTESPEYRVSISSPGEFEAADVSIIGIAAHRHLDNPESSSMNSNIYSLNIDNIRVAILGNIYPDLSDDQLEAIGMTDILIAPVGGNGYTLDGISAATLTRKIEPKIVIPIHYNDSSLKYEVPQDGAEPFIAELKAPVKEDKKLRIKSSVNIPETIEIYKLSLTK